MTRGAGAVFDTNRENNSSGCLIIRHALKDWNGSGEHKKEFGEGLRKRGIVLRNEAIVTGKGS